MILDLFKKKNELNNVEIIVKDTPEQFMEIKDELIKFLTDMLLELSEKEDNVFKKTHIYKGKDKKGFPIYEMVPIQKIKECFEKYREECKNIISSKCTEKLISRGYASHAGTPSEYFYLKTGCKLIFTMKSEDEAIIETYYKKGTEMKSRFVLINTVDGWKVDDVKYGFQNEENKWQDKGI